MFEDICLKKTRADVLRVAAKDYRVRFPSDRNHRDKFLDESKIQVWDLKEELAEID